MTSQSATLQELFRRIAEQKVSKMRPHRLGAGQKLSDVDVEELLLFIRGLSLARQLNLDQARRCLRPSQDKPKRTLWNATLSCAAKEVPGGYRTGTSLPMDARLDSPFFHRAQKYYSKLSPANKALVGANRNAFIVDAAIDAERRAARNAWDSADQDDFEKLEAMVAYLRNPDPTGTFSQGLEQYVEGAWEDELEKRRSRGGPSVQEQKFTQGPGQAAGESKRTLDLIENLRPLSQANREQFIRQLPPEQRNAIRAHLAEGKKGESVSGPGQLLTRPANRPTDIGPQAESEQEPTPSGGGGGWFGSWFRSR